MYAAGMDCLTVDVGVIGERKDIVISIESEEPLQVGMA